MPKIIDKFYNAGLNAFAEGKTVRHVAETLNKLNADDPESPPAENKSFRDRENDSFSFLMGFLDGVLAKVRRIR